MTGRIYPGPVDGPLEVLSTPVRRRAMDSAAREVMDELLLVPGVVRVGLALTEGGGRRLLFTASDRAPADPVGPGAAEVSEGSAQEDARVEWCHIDAYDDVPLTAAVRTGRPVLGDLETLDATYADLVERQRKRAVAGLAALPLVGSGPPLGGLVLFYETRQAFDDAQRDDLERRAAELAERLRAVQATAPRSGPGLADQQVGPGVTVSDLVVDADPRAVGETRRHLRAALSGWGVDDDTADTAVLCLSEVITNAIIHTGAPSEMRAALDRGVLTVTVRDRGASSRPADEPRDETDPLRVHGRGLQVVEELSDRWGSELDAVGATVWFVLEVAPDPT